MTTEQRSHIELCRTQMRYAQARMKTTFAAVPPERMDWSPTPTSKTPMQILTHCVDANGQVIAVARGDSDMASPNTDFAISSPEEAIRQLDQNLLDFEEALGTLTGDRLNFEAGFPGGSLPVSEWIHFIGWHLAEHAAQIDYIQTCWNDQESRYPQS